MTARASVWSFHPRRVGVWHFIVVPTLTMAAVVFFSRRIDRLLLPAVDPASHDVYTLVRNLAISLVMASVVAWLAVSYRSQYEERLRVRNEMLEATRAFLARIIDGSAEAIVTLDRELRVISWNAAAERIYLRPAASVMGRSLEVLLPSSERGRREIEHLRGALQRGQTLRDREATHVREGGQPILVRLTLSPLLGPDGSPEGGTAIIRDVSALVEMERRLRERERLAAVGQLAAQVAHEIKNPLAGIRGACEIMVPRLSGTGMQEVAEEVVRQIDRLNRTVEELLEFSRPSRTTQLPTDLHALIDTVVGMLMRQRRASTVEIERVYDERLPSIPLDPFQIQQVLYNVLLNACQAMDYHGRLTIATALDEIHVVIEVCDSGPGIPEGAREAIFEPFFTTRTEGTGLGLAIVKKIVEAHGGTIEAGAAPAGGAAFRILLPLTIEPRSAG